MKPMKRDIVRKRNEENRELKQFERLQNRKKAKQEEDIDLGRLFEITTSNKIHVNGLNLHENKIEILLDYTGDFEMIGSMLIGEREQKTNIKFKNVDDFEGHINAIDVDYDSEDVIFIGWLNKLNTPEFNRVNGSRHGRGTDFKQENVEYTGNNCFIPNSTNCFLECINY